jgi:omega-6 fatty acid desaturase (delta-12 desaturase)
LNSTSIAIAPEHAADHGAHARIQPEGDRGNAKTYTDARAAKAVVLGRQVAKQFAAYGTDLKRSLFQLVTTGLLFAATLAMMALLSQSLTWLSVLLIIPAAGLLVRLFIIQHDCGHGSFFKSRTANDMLGRAIGVLTLTPYSYWKQGHAIHHASTGNLERRGRGDVDTLTVSEYLALPPGKQLGYRLYRSPFVQVLIGAPLNFIVLQRIPRGRTWRDPFARNSMLTLNAALLVAFGVPMAIFGVVPVLALYLPVIIVASWIGNWLFYVQHQFEDAYWEQHEDWNFFSAALHGSSYFILPPVLQWFSGNIGLHHIHHLCSRIPNYRLQACMDAMPEMQHLTTRITLIDSIRCWKLTLWDEQSRRLVGFGDVAAMGA